MADEKKKIDTSMFDSPKPSRAKVDTSVFDDAARARRDAIEPMGSTTAGMLGLMAGPAGAVIGAMAGPNDVGKSINENIDQPSRSAVGLPRTGKEFAEKVVPDPNSPHAQLVDPHGLRSKFVDNAYEIAASPLNLLPWGQKALKATGEWLAGGSAAKSDKWILNATGATGKEAQGFAENAPKVLRDEGIVRAGMTQAQIAEAAEKARLEAGKEIGRIVQELETKGAPASDRQEIALKMLQKAAELQKRNHEPDRQVGAALEELATRFANNEQKNLALSEVELEKRGFDEISQWNKATTPTATVKANREAANILRGHVEEVATKVDPKLGAAFKREKDIFGVMSPIETAASRRASVTNQSPPLGLSDMWATGTGTTIGAAVGAAPGLMTGNPLLAKAGAAVGGTMGTVTGAAIRRTIQPRFSSTAAAFYDTAAKMLGTEYVKPMEVLLETGVVSLPKIEKMIQSAEGRGSLKLILKDVAKAPSKQPEAPPGPIERLKRRTKSK